jgi:hypothetical protein
VQGVEHAQGVDHVAEVREANQEYALRMAHGLE